VKSRTKSALRGELEDERTARLLAEENARQAIRALREYQDSSEVEFVTRMYARVDEERAHVMRELQPSIETMRETAAAAVQRARSVETRLALFEAFCSARARPDRVSSLEKITRGEFKLREDGATVVASTESEDLVEHIRQVIRGRLPELFLD
jgi:hypothetical protein